MLKFVELKQETPEKGSLRKGRVILMKSIKSLLLIKLPNNQADVLNVEFHFVKYIVL